MNWLKGASRASKRSMAASSAAICAGADQRGVMGRRVGRRQLGAQSEQLVLNPRQQRIDRRRRSAAARTMPSTLFSSSTVP